MQKRKSHNKSRNGCRNCKRRHVKCDEQGPPCANCIARDVEGTCTYSAALGNPSPEIQSGSDHKRGFISDSRRRLELELMHRWSTSTYKSFCSIPQDNEWLQIHVPRWTLKHDFLLHGVLSISALEIALCGEPVMESDPVWYAKAGLEYYDQASKLYRTEIRHITPDNLQPVWVFSSIALAINTAIVQCEHLLRGVEAPMSVMTRTIALLELLRGSSAIAMTHFEELMKGPPGESIQIVLTSLRTPLSSPLPDSIGEMLTRLDIIVDKGIRVPSEGGEEVREVATARLNSYKTIVNALRICFVEDFKDHIKGLCISFPDLAGPGLVRAFQASEPLALFLLMYWGVLLDRLGKLAWWAKSIGKAMVAELSEDLARLSDHADLEMVPMEDWRRGVDWARNEVGLPTSQTPESATTEHTMTG